MLQFAPKKPPQHAPSPTPQAPAVAATKNAPPHKLVKVAKIAAFLGVDIRIIHGYIRRNKLRKHFIPGNPISYVYADEAVAVVRRSSVKRGGDSHTVRENTLLSWNKGDGRREVGLVQNVRSKQRWKRDEDGTLTKAPGSVEFADVDTSNKPFMALCEKLEEQVAAKQVVLEQPLGVLKLVEKYLTITQVSNPAIKHLRSAIEAFNSEEPV